MILSPCLSVFLNVCVCGGWTPRMQLGVVKCQLNTVHAILTPLLLSKLKTLSMILIHTYV